MAEGEVEGSPPCPVCGRTLPLTGLERHVNSHLDEAESARDHALALELASTSQPSMQDADSWKSSLVTCTECGEMIPLEDWASHSSMHEIQAEEDMKDIQRNDAECKSNKDEIALKRQRTQECASTSRTDSTVVNGLDMQCLMRTQRKGIFRFVNEGIMNLLRECLFSENRSSSCTVISAHIDHFETCASEDVGWGCGWRNIQMLSSHLLTHKWGKEALFGGASFVPNIPCLQQWLEFAWARGFDEPGAEFYDHKIHGSKEWIGTAECAALFRSFGLRARIVDFSTVGGKLKKDGQTSIDRWLQHHASRNSDAQRKKFNELPVNTQIHHDIQCDVCGVYPIRGIRFKSKKTTDYDLCSSCMSSDGNPDDYEKLDSTNTNSASKGKEVASDEDVNHESLVKWVWNYFTGGIKDVTMKAHMDQFQGHIAASGCIPLYFQHQGHSRTIVGIQRRKRSTGSKEDIFLLVLDPSSKTEELLHALRCKKQWQKLIKRGIHTLKKRSYQVCYIEPGIAQGEELEQLKILRSEQILY